MAKRVQEKKDKKRFVSKSRPTAMNLSSTVPASSSSAKNLITSSDPGKLIAAGKPASRTRRSSRADEAPISPAKLQDVHFGGLMDDSAGKPVATEENQVLRDFSESESSSVHENEVTGEFCCIQKQCGETCGFQNFRKFRKSSCWKKVMATYFYISSAVVSYMDKVYSIAKKTYHRKPTDEMEDLGLNAAIWGMFMNTTLQAAVHLRQDNDQNLRFVNISGVLWRSCSKKLKKWSWTRERPLVYHWLITKITHGARQACCLTEFTRARMPRPTSSQTQCCLGG